jgi:hypothetical protein
VIRGVNDTADQWWAVSMTPLTKIDTADQWWAVSMTPLTKIDTADQETSKFRVLWLLLKGIPIEKSYLGKLHYIISTTFTVN